VCAGDNEEEGAGSQSSDDTSSNNPWGPFEDEEPSEMEDLDGPVSKAWTAFTCHDGLGCNRLGVMYHAAWLSSVACL